MFTSEYDFFGEKYVFQYPGLRTAEKAINVLRNVGTDGVVRPDNASFLEYCMENIIVCPKLKLVDFESSAEGVQKMDLLLRTCELFLTSGLLPGKISEDMVKSQEDVNYTYEKISNEYIKQLETDLKKSDQHKKK